MPMLEVCCFNPSSAIVAGEAGADRIELCDNQQAGGTTPAAEWLAHVKSRVTVPIFVMIRPRGGDFNYSDAEFKRMKTEIDHFKATADGFVFGILDHQRHVDVARTAELVRRAEPLRCTFHRAFDETPEPLLAFEDVIATGCHAVLSSGGAANVNSGMDVLRILVQRGRRRITVMPGGGVRSSNLARLQRVTGAEVFHSSAMHQDSSLPDATEIRKMRQLLQEYASGDAVASPDVEAPPGESLQDATGSVLDMPAVSTGVTPVDERHIDF